MEGPWFYVKKVHFPLFISNSRLLWDFTFADTLLENILLLPFFFPQVSDPSKPSMGPSSRQLIQRQDLHTGLDFPWALLLSPLGARSQQGTARC